MSNKAPSTIKECVTELIIVLEESNRLPTASQKASILKCICTELVAFLKLKEWISEEKS